MPMMPFIGVRISWLTVARKRDFAWLANSARSRALISAISARLRSAMSRALVARRQLDPGKPALALRRLDGDVGRAETFAVGESGVGDDPHLDAELGQRAAGKLVLADADELGEDLVRVHDAAFAIAVDGEVAE